MQERRAIKLKEKKRINKDIPSSRVTREEIEVCDILNRLDIPYMSHHHKAFFTAADSHVDGYYQPGYNVKNLVMHDRKTDEYYMVVVEDHLRMDFKTMKALTGWSKKTVFAEEQVLVGLMGVSAGSCSIFGLIRDRESKVNVILTETIAKAKLNEQINFHPNINTATLTISVADMHKFLEWTGNRIIFECGEDR